MASFEKKGLSVAICDFSDYSGGGRGGSGIQEKTRPMYKIELLAIKKLPEKMWKSKAYLS